MLSWKFPNSLTFHTFRSFFTNFSFPIRDLSWELIQAFLITSRHPLCKSQVSCNRNGFGPQLILWVKINDGQWSEILRWTIETLKTGKVWSFHSGWTRSRSSLLLEAPQNQVNESSEAGISTNWRSRMKEMKSEDLVGSIKWLYLSSWHKTSLKSPRIKQGNWECEQNSTPSLPIKALWAVQQG